MIHFCGNDLKVPTLPLRYGISSADSDILGFFVYIAIRTDK